jgi:hypothetical protein
MMLNSQRYPGFFMRFDGSAVTVYPLLFNTTLTIRWRNKIVVYVNGDMDE